MGGLQCHVYAREALQHILFHFEHNLEWLLICIWVSSALFSSCYFCARRNCQTSLTKLQGKNVLVFNDSRLWHLFLVVGICKMAMAFMRGSFRACGGIKSCCRQSNQMGPGKTQTTASHEELQGGIQCWSNQAVGIMHAPVMCNIFYVDSVFFWMETVAPAPKCGSKIAFRPSEHAKWKCMYQ